MSLDPYTVSRTPKPLKSQHYLADLIELYVISSYSSSKAEGVCTFVISYHIKKCKHHNKLSFSQILNYINKKVCYDLTENIVYGNSVTVTKQIFCTGYKKKDQLAT